MLIYQKIQTNQPHLTNKHLIVKFKTYKSNYFFTKRARQLLLFFFKQLPSRIKDNCLNDNTLLRKQPASST